MARVISVFSTKGGTGKTLIATNLGVSLAKENKKTLLLDLDLQAVGDMAKMLNLHPEKSLANILSLKDFSYKDIVISHSCGIDFLPFVLRPRQSPHIKPEFIREILSLASRDYEFIICDCGRAFTETQLACFNYSNLIFLVVTPDILSIYQTKWTIDTLQSLNFPLKIIKVILNRSESLGAITWQEVRAVLPCEVIARVYSEGRIVGFSVNRGIPVVLDSPRSKTSEAIKKLAGDLCKKPEIFVGSVELQKRLKPEAVSLEREGEFWQRFALTEKVEELEIFGRRDELIELKRRIHEKLIGKLNLKKLDLKLMAEPKKFVELKEKVVGIISDLLTEETGEFISSLEVRQHLVKDLVDEALGLGPLEDLLADPEITDIMVNNKDEVYIERGGKIELTTKKFISNEQVRTIIERIIAPIGRRIDESAPMVDARLPDGSRVNAIIPPLSLTGPTLTIRKFRKERLKIQDLQNFKTLDEKMAEFLKACVISRKNIVVSGGTGSGKTSVLNVLSSFIPNRERIVTIEDAAELKLDQEHWVRLESRPPNIEGKGTVTIRDLFRNTLRMRPDRIIIGECRSAETLDMLQAMNTGHDGSMTTVHANSTHDVLSRLDSMILMSGTELPIRAIREMIASAIDLIVHTARLPDGSRKVIQITEVTGMLDEIHIGLKDIFVFKQFGVDDKGNVLGDFFATSYTPSFLEDIRVRGIPLSEEIFKA